jgi:hypothetical protein
MELLNLPSCLAISVLSSWVEVQDVARLDTTYCNHTLRPRLLTVLRSTELVLSKTGRANGYKTPAAWLKWHAERGVKASAFVLARNISDVFPEIIASFLAAVGGSKLRTVIAHNLEADVQTLFGMMAITCKFVECLCAYDCPSLLGVEALIRCCSASLTSIVVEQSVFSMDKFEVLRLPNVQLLRLKGKCAPLQITNLLRCCVSVVEVVLDNLIVEDTCIETLEGYAERLTRLYLKVIGVSGAALIRLGSRCSRLRSLFLRVPSSAEEVVETFVKTASQLSSVGLKGHVTDEALCAVASQCGNRLRHLFVGVLDEGLAGEVGVAALSKHCTALESLRCSCVAKGSHARIVGFIAAQKGLLSLNVKSLSITDAYLQALGDNCPKLQEILLSGTTGYTATGLMRLIEGCPNIGRVQVGADDPIVNEMVRLLWAKVRPGVIFDHSAIAQACWQ